MPILTPMTQPEYEAFVESAIPEFAADNVRAGHWSESEALEKSREGYEKLLPKGLETENHCLYTLYDVDEKFRGKGYGKQAMLLIEEKARELGLTSLGLHVFAVNAVARNLYESVESEVSSLNMTKKL